MVAHLDEQLMHERLHRARVARIGYLDGDGPVVVPINIAVDEDERIVFRTAVDGPLAALDGQRVAIEIDGIDPPRRSGWSILVRGVARDVTDASDAVAARAQTVPVDCWAPGTRDRTLVVLPLGSPAGSSRSARTVTGSPASRRRDVLTAGLSRRAASR